MIVGGQEEGRGKDIRTYTYNIISLPEEKEKFITRQPPIGEKDDYDSENSWISDGLPSSSRRKRRGGERVEREVECKRGRRWSRRRQK